MERHRHRRIIILAAATAILLGCIHLLPSADPQSDGRRSLRPMPLVLDPKTVTEKSTDAAIPAYGDVPLNTGPWSAEEHDLFLQGLATHDPPHERAWRKISREVLPTRSEDQLLDHWREYHRWDHDLGRDPDRRPYVPAVASASPWSEEEHALFLEGLGEHGHGPAAYAEIADAVGTRSFGEVSDHADEYFAGLAQGDRAPSEIFGWPSDEDRDIPPGTYFYNGRHRWKDLLRSYRITQEPGYGRVLLYISTHFSYQHILYLRYCWKNVLARSPLLQEADVAVHLNPNDAKRRKAAMDLLKDVFAGHNLMVYVRHYKDAYLEGGTKGVPLLKVKQSGAVMAMYEAVKHRYFDGYDWVIRVNPDVLIRDDSYFREAMANPELSALLVNCHHETKKQLHLHTDFFVVRPGVLREEEFPKEILAGGAEMSFTTSLRNTVLRSSPPNFEWIPGADPASKKTCRVGQGRDFFDSPVVHEHALHPNICWVPLGQRKNADKVFSKGWPKNWKPVN